MTAEETGRGPIPWQHPGSARAASCWVVLALLAAMVGPGLALDPVTVRSHSGQFVVRGLPVGTTFSRSPTSGVEYLRLDPALTAVSLERIRQTLLAELRLPNVWRGTVQISTHPVTQDRVSVRIASVRYKDRWGYRVDLPERIEKDRFFAVAVEVILTEIANRQAVLREAELPPWLATGLAAELLATSLPTLALEPGGEIAQRDRNPDPLRIPRELLRARPALRFDELCQPLPEPFSEAEAEFYRACAHVFVHELLSLRSGPECLRQMLTRLPENLNWQTTFLECFGDHFPRLIDADKWYSLNAVNLRGRDHLSAWSLPSTVQQLDDLLSVEVQVRLDASELPIHSKTTLQRVIAEWDFAKQHPLLLQRLNRLQALRLRAAVEAIELVDEYVRVLQAYAFGREGTATKAAGRSPSQLRAAARTAIQQLDGLETRRQALRDGLAAARRAP